ncbi:Predicted protein [Taphrina deformans PYCC 5710]|uniref:CRAL-TRIO domain-containing protein n=1 Tax=Taphrina deformans (strain PYCC 5710 / ATCC 11124 / CBS 356.35 / IMI 108563 / JCM 9778 / NBRC 8474) TaxID=1097556 RepID=R4XJ95_TAPDE|nr:Predicted protein [Taphrina deformans PYCC 5710]|eukprot:CCG83435.1 Predicted protein [Taphrina deformans PYCC 5710]
MLRKSLYYSTLFSSVYVVKLQSQVRLEDIIPPISNKAKSYEKKLLGMLNQEGRPGNLTAEEEGKLKELWAATLKVFGKTASSDLASVENEVEGYNATGSTDTLQVPGTSPVPKKRGRLTRMLTRSKSDASDVSDNSLRMTPSATSLASQSSSKDESDKYSQSTEFKEALATQTPQELRDQFWSMVKADHPDGLLLRFLRARKWDVQKALIMMISTMHWRGKEMNVEKIMRGGELGAIQDGDDQFILQIRKGKSIIHGTDNDGRPVCIVRSRLHRPAEQTARVMECYTVYIMETARLMLRGPVDTASIIFDLSNIEAKYMDLTPVRFIIKCFEAHYPESLGVCCIYGAPWFFRPVWSVVKGLLDPVVANKIRFANSTAELETFLPGPDIIKELGGPRDWEYEYIEPAQNENDLMKDTVTRDKLLADRAKLYDQFEMLTKKWFLKQLDAGGVQRREACAKALEQDYWKIDPYVRAKTHYDRVGYLEPDGKFNPRATHVDTALAA